MLRHEHQLALPFDDERYAPLMVVRITVLTRCHALLLHRCPCNINGALTPPSGCCLHNTGLTATA